MSEFSGGHLGFEIREQDDGPPSFLRCLFYVFALACLADL